MELLNNPNKRINIISKEIIQNGEVVQQGGLLMRTTRSYAAQLLANGTHTTTSKGKLKSFLNKNHKLHNNSKVINVIDFEDKKCPHRVIKDSFNNRTYVLIKKKEVKQTMINKEEIDPMTMLPRSFDIMVPRYQALVASYSA